MTNCYVKFISWLCSSHEVEDGVRALLMAASRVWSESAAENDSIIILLAELQMFGWARIYLSLD